MNIRQMLVKKSYFADMQLKVKFGTCKCLCIFKFPAVVWKKKNAQRSQLDPKLLITLFISFRNTNFYFQYDTKCKP